MLQRPYQFRFYGNGDARNHPAGLTSDELSTGAFLGRIKNENIKGEGIFILQVGVHSVPGVQLKINRGQENWIEVPDTGIYELNLAGFGFIRDIRFNTENSWWMDTFGDNPAREGKNQFLFVDILY